MRLQNVATNNIYLINSDKLESLKLKNVKEVEALQEQSKRLQVQLNNGYTAFADYKSKKSAEIATLESNFKDAKAAIIANQTADGSTPKVNTGF